MPRKKSDPVPDAPTKAAKKSTSAKSSPQSSPKAARQAVPKAVPEAPARESAAALPPAPVQTLHVETPKEPVDSVHDLLEQLRRGDLASRSAAALRLGELGDVAAGSALAEALRDPTAELACEAAAALGRLEDPAALHALIAVVLNRDGYFHSTVRTAAAESLGRLVDPRSVDALVTAVFDPVGETSLAAVTALGRIGELRAFEEPGARAALETAASNGNGFFLPQVQQAAVEALGRIRA